MSRRLVIGFALVAMVVAAPALALTRGSSMFSIHLANGTADLVGPEDGDGYISAYDHSEWGVQAQYQHMMSEDYAFVISGGIGMFSETNEPGDNAAPGDGDFDYTQSSWNLRIGGDRVVSVGERALLYFGPGIEYWSGSAEFEETGVGSIESETVTRISLTGRLGAVMTIGSGNWGLGGHIQHRIGYATAEDAGAKATWWPSGFDAAGGLVFRFGGN